MIEDNIEVYEDEDDIMLNDRIIRAKWTIDGANTLAEAAEQLREFANELQELHNQGWILRDTIRDDYGFTYKEEMPDG